ncbi:hypothetical protein CTAM01_03548 [Colletotrichum tamarilloi]|uniref:Secreted protein n=1 Tax=Colletotrichum tamarilloi TaxID=1209934 RepID=A0ABQ9RK10_9PEZI|nr:uncharacterized protein CTAM01_03548 [Colletotrichum tamarilloi]KAK1506213.1 hypothetical protein CTAM01_03548 [Colletotrichum tamarilloi]
MIKPPFAPTPPPFLFFLLHLSRLHATQSLPNNPPQNLCTFFLTMDFPNVARISSSPPHSPEYSQTRMLPKTCKQLSNQT